MTEKLKAFRAQYDPYGNWSWTGVKFRPGAAFTGRFGLTDGFRSVDGKYVWGWPRIHTGTDRAQAKDGDGVFEPFDTDYMRIHGDGGALYGTLWRHIVGQWGFELRIAHMDPRTDIEPYMVSAIAEGANVSRGERLGKAGRFGVSFGEHPEHTHGEVVSIGATSELLDEILFERYGTAADLEYGSDDVVKFYRSRETTASWSSDQILEDYAMLMQNRGIVWSGIWKQVFEDPYTAGRRTRYSSELLFGM